MNTNLRYTLSLWILMALAPTSTVLAQTKATVAVGKVAPTDALKADMARRGKIIEMNRVVEALDGHLISALGATRKFTLVGRSDLADILKEQELGDSGLVNPDTAPQAGQLTGAKYRMAVTVDSFLDERVEARFGTTGRRGIKRRLQLSAQAKIYDTTTGELLDAPNWQLERVETLIVSANENNTGQRTDEAMPKLAREMAEKMATRLVDVVFPARVIDVEDTLVTINRGDGFNIKVGEIWHAYAPAKEIVDPDTGVTIKRKGRMTGKVKITSVEANYSQGEIIEGKVIPLAVLKRPSVPTSNPSE